MSYPINYPTPQNANVQIFRGGDLQTTGHLFEKTWVKPQGASFVWFTLIGAGGGGGGGVVDNATPAEYFGGGGASGNVTNFMCPAFFLPDALQIVVGKGGNGGAGAIDTAADAGVDGANTQIFYQQKTGTGYELLIASGGGGGVGATFGNSAGGAGRGPNAGGPMTAAGFYNATGGQNGANGNTTISTNGLTFVMGGDGSNNATSTITGYYGYNANNTFGYSQISPIIMAISGSPSGTSTNRSAPSPFGCGGNGGFGGGNGSTGGDGMVIIVTW
jgi:hypothetical protein